VPESSSQKRKILIIDDNVNITKMFTKFFELKGYVCLMSNNGRNGLTLLEDQIFDAVILDVAMPDFTGFDVIDELENKNMLTKQKVIVLTATAIKNEKLNELHEKGIVVLNKPVSLGELISVIEE